MSELPTPETDALFFRNGYPVEVDSSKAMQLCEKLEQERDWITEKFKLLESCFKGALHERDEAREENKKFREALEWIAERYDDSKPMHSVAMDAYEMSCTARAALRKEEA